MKLLEVKELSVHYGGIQAMNKVSFQVNKGEIVTLVGANGAGKSTCLRAITGLVKATSGEIWFEGKRIDNMRTEKIVGMGISHVPEGRRLFPYMSVNDNLITGAFLRKNKEEVSKNLDKTYSYFPNIESKKRQLAINLSGGQQQMVACGRGIMSNARLILFDEPSLGLAPMLVQEIGRQIEQFAQEGITVILVEQNANMAFSISDRAYVLEKGTVVLEGPSKDLQNDDYVKSAYLGV